MVVLCEYMWKYVKTDAEPYKRETKTEREKKEKKKWPSSSLHCSSINPYCEWVLEEHVKFFRQTELQNRDTGTFTMKWISWKLLVCVNDIILEKERDYKGPKVLEFFCFYYKNNYFSVVERYRVWSRPLFLSYVSRVGQFIDKSSVIVFTAWFLNQ